jgi:DNA-binding beta-propeller fold protein YncE
MIAPPNGQYAWVASSRGFTAIGTHSNQASGLIPVPGGVGSMAYHNSVWVTAGHPPANRTEVIPVSETGMTAGSPVTFAPGPGAGPAPLVYGRYTMNFYAGSALGVVTEILPHSGKVGRVIPFGVKDPHGTAHLAVSPDGLIMYAWITDPARTVTTVTPIRLDTGKAGKPVTVGQGPLAILFSADSHTAWVLSSGAGPVTSAPAKITPVNPYTGKTASPISLGPTASAAWMSMTPDGRKIYVSARWAGKHANSLFSISTATHTILKEIRPSYPGPVAFTPDGKTAFVIDGGPGLGQGAVVSVTTATDAYHPGFAVGEGPVAIVVLRQGNAQTG